MEFFEVRLFNCLWFDDINQFLYVTSEALVCISNAVNDNFDSFSIEHIIQEFFHFRPLESIDAAT